MDASPPATPDWSPAILLNTSPISVPEMPTVPALFHTATLFEHVADPTPNGIGIELPEAMPPLLPSVVTAPPLVLASPEGRVKLLVDGDPAAIDASPPAAPGQVASCLVECLSNVGAGDACCSCIIQYGHAFWACG